MEETVFLNGRFLPAREAKIPISDPGFLLGYGVFETMRSYNNRIVYFCQHLKRLEQACKLIKLEFSYSLRELEAAIKKTLKINNFKDAYVRLTLWRAKQGTGALIIVRKYRSYSLQRYRTGFSACVSEFRQNEFYNFMHIKSTSYILYRLAYSRAKEMGFEEAIILNNLGYISEGSRCNIFLVKDNTLFSPCLSSGCLAGITRKAAFDLAKKNNIKNYEAELTLQDLYEADEAFLTNSLIGIMPLVAVENHKIGNGIAGKLTKRLIKKYFSLLGTA